MSTVQKKLRVGQEEFWDKAMAANPRAFEALQNLIALSARLVQEPGNSPLENVMQRILSVMMDSAGSVVILCFNGYCADALKVSRTVWEASLTVSYLRKFPEEVNDYLDFVLIGDKRDMDVLDALGSKLEIPHERRDEINREYLRVRSRFLKRDPKDVDDLRGSWCRSSIFQMCKEIGRTDHYKTFYGMSSGMVHVSVVGLKAQSDKNGEMVYAPNLMHIDNALMTAHSSILCAMHDYNDTAKLGFEKEIAEASKVFQDIWKVNENE